MSNNLENYKVTTTAKLLEIITSPENINLSRFKNKKLSFELENSLNGSVISEDNPLYDFVSIICLSIDSKYPIIKKTKPPFIMRSLSIALYIFVPLLILFYFGSEKIPNEGAKNWLTTLLTLFFALFFGFFVYNYTSFNNKWKYAADLYNKIYFESFSKDDSLEFFRKRCLLSQDIYDLKLHPNASFNYEFYKNLTLAAIVYDTFLGEGTKSYAITSNSTLEFYKNPEIILSKVSSLILDTIEKEKLNGMISLEDKNQKLEKENKELKTYTNVLKTKILNGVSLDELRNEINSEYKKSS